MVESSTQRSGSTLALVFAACLAPPAASRAVTPLDWVAASPDVAVELAAVTVDDRDVAVDDLFGSVVPASLGSLPANADLTAYHLLDDGDQLFSLDTAVTLSGPVTAERGDGVRYDGASYALELDASAEGIPSGAITDAVTVSGEVDPLLSFDVAVELPAAPGTIIAFDEDLVGFDGSVSSVVFDGSAAGVPETLDLDGAHDLGGGRLGLSFDGSGTLDAVDFDDEDILEYDPVGSPSWEMAYDGSTEHAELTGGPDLNAVAPCRNRTTCCCSSRASAACCASCAAASGADPRAPSRRQPRSPSPTSPDSRLVAVRSPRGFSRSSGGRARRAELRRSPGGRPRGARRAPPWRRTRRPLGARRRPAAARPGPPTRRSPSRPAPLRATEPAAWLRP